MSARAAGGDPRVRAGPASRRSATPSSGRAPACRWSTSTGYYWQPGWVETPLDEWRAIQRTAFAADAVDRRRQLQRARSTMRLRRADTVVFLDFPPWRTIPPRPKRSRHRRGQAVQAEGCPERLDREFLWWVATYRRRSRPHVLRRDRTRSRRTPTSTCLRTPRAVADVRRREQRMPGRFRPSIPRTVRRHRRRAGRSPPSSRWPDQLGHGARSPPRQATRPDERTPRRYRHVVPEQVPVGRVLGTEDATPLDVLGRARARSSTSSSTTSSCASGAVPGPRRAGAALRASSPRCAPARRARASTPTCSSSPTACCPARDGRGRRGDDDARRSRGVRAAAARAPRCARATGDERDDALFFDQMKRELPIGLGRDGCPMYAEPRVHRRHARRARQHLRHLRRGDEDHLRDVPALRPVPLGRARRRARRTPRR